MDVSPDILAPYGLAPPPVDASMPGQDNYALPPFLQQAYGLAPPAPPTPQPTVPPDAPPPDIATPPPIPQSLPSMQEQPPAPQQPVPSRDYVVPAPQTAAPAPAPAQPAGKPPAQPKPQTFEQGMADVQQQERAANAEKIAANAAQTQAELGKNADVLAAYNQHQSTLDDINAKRQAFQDEANKVTTAKMLQIEQANRAADNYKVDRGKYWDGLGVGDKVGWSIAMALSEVGNALQHKQGPNPVIQMLQERIADGVREQMDERDRLDRQAGRARQDLADYEHFSSNRIAQFDYLMGQANTHLANEVALATAKAADPVTKANGMKQEAEIRAQAAQQQQSAVQLASQHDLAVKQNQIAAGHLALADKQFQAEYGPQGFKQQELQLQAAKLMQAGKQQQAKELVTRGVGGLTVDGKTPAEDGSNVFLAPTEKEGEELRKQKAGVDTVNEFVNDMSRQIKANGGASKWLQSPDFQKMMAKKESLIFALHQAYGVAGFRPGVLEQMEKALGGTDPTSFFRSAEPGLKAARDSLNRTFTAQLRVMDPRFKGEYKPEDTSSPAEPSKTEAAMAIEDALKRPAEVLESNPGKRELEFGEQTSPPTASPRERSAPYLNQLAASGNVLPSVRQNIATWGAMLDVPDQAARAEAILKKIAETSDSPETAALAKDVLARRMSTSMMQVNASPEATRGSSGLPVHQVPSAMPMP